MTVENMSAGERGARLEKFVRSSEKLTSPALPQERNSVGIEESGMAQGDEEVEELKRLISAFTAELDTPTMPYINEGLLEFGLLTKMSDSDRAAGKPGLTVGYTLFDAGRASELLWEATSLKRSGHYLTSAEKTIEAFRLDGHYDLVDIRNLWKTALCGGDARGAVALIRQAVSTYERYEIARRHEQLPCPPHHDLADVLEALKTEQSCKTRLHAFSGNPAYVLPRPYRAIMADLQGQGTPLAAPNPQPASQIAQRLTPRPAVQPDLPGACYIATAVYGSYDAPEVRILRDFRDERLSRSPAGRAFIRFYYSVGPAAASHFDGDSALTLAVRAFLDAIVRRLDHRGVGGASRPAARSAIPNRGQDHVDRANVGRKERAAETASRCRSSGRTSGLTADAAGEAPYEAATNEPVAGLKASRADSSRDSNATMVPAERWRASWDSLTRSANDAARFRSEAPLPGPRICPAKSNTRIGARACTTWCTNLRHAGRRQPRRTMRIESSDPTTGSPVTFPN